MWNALAIILHLLAINVWVGGTFFSVVILKHAATSLEPSQQLGLMQVIFRRFFFWVWIAILVLLSSGGWMVYSIFGSIGTAPRYIVLMVVLALLMMTVFVVIFFGPYRQFQKSLALEDIASSQRQLAWIGLLSTINMVLGVCVVLVIGGGPHFLV